MASRSARRILTLDLSPLDSAGDSAAIAYEGGLKGPQVPLTTIDKLVQELKLERVDFIKMDIEGAEKKALLGATATLHKYRPRLAVATEHLPDDPVAIPSLVLGHWPEYKMSCGPCSDQMTAIRPEVVYFRAGS